jgi:hypothetical protein
MIMTAVATIVVPAIKKIAGTTTLAKICIANVNVDFLSDNTASDQCVPEV